MTGPTRVNRGCSPSLEEGCITLKSPVMYIRYLRAACALLGSSNASIRWWPWDHKGAGNICRHIRGRNAACNKVHMHDKR